MKTIFKYLLAFLAPLMMSASCNGENNGEEHTNGGGDSEDTIERSMVIVEQAGGKIAIVNRLTGKVEWEWSVDTSDIPAEHHSWFLYPDEAKPVYNCEYILMTSESGGCGIIRIRDSKMMFYAYPKGSPHSIELLPDGNIVVASSSNNTPEADQIKLYKVDTLNSPALAPVATYPLKSGHNVVWDKKSELLWATAYDELRCYTYTPGPDPSLSLKQSVSLPNGEKEAHDLFPVYGENTLWLTTPVGIWKYDVSTATFTSVTANTVKNVKSVSSGPEGYETIMIAATTDYWSERVVDLQGRVVYRNNDFRMYKSRWMVDCLFSYPEVHKFTQPE